MDMERPDRAVNLQLSSSSTASRVKPSSAEPAAVLPTDRLIKPADQPSRQPHLETFPAAKLPVDTSARAAPRRETPRAPARFRSSLEFLNLHLHVPTILIALIECLTFHLCAAASVTFLAAGAVDLAGALSQPQIAAASLMMWTAAAAMGLYRGGQRDGTTGLFVRGFLGLCVLAPLAVLLVSTLVPDFRVSITAALLAGALALPALLLCRRVGVWCFDNDLFKPRTIVLGTGREALRITNRMRRLSDRRGFDLVAFVRMDTENLITGWPVLELADGETLLDLCRAHEIDEILVAWDDRRGGVSQRMPLEALLNCKMAGLQVTELSAFFEREAGRIDIDVLRPSWLLFNQGFSRPLKRGAKRLFDLGAALGLFAVTWPVMLAAALAIKLEDGWRAPVLYSQIRVGHDQRPYRVLKFRSMRVDAEQIGEAVWAQQHDPRVTRVGRILRALRIDELPQIFNILTGDMAFVGPRPERPMFVHRFQQEIPFYRERHRVKPGLTGWAQINYPYGACDEDAKKKLEYDLYYVKNYSLLLDLIILLRTVEVVLIGKGAR